MDNSITKKYWAGIYTASDSFALIWKRPELLVYLTSTTLFYVIFDRLCTGKPFLGFIGYMLTVIFTQPCATHTEQCIHLLLPLSFLYFFIITAAQVALVRHTMALVSQEKEQMRIARVASHVKKALSHILVWAMLITFINYIFFNTAQYCSEYSSAMKISAITLWALAIPLLWTWATFFVIPLIAISSTTILQTLKKSWQVARNQFFQILGTQSWILIASLIIFTPLLILYPLLCHKTGICFICDLITIIIILCFYLILTAQTIVKTILYLNSINSTH